MAIVGDIYLSFQENDLDNTGQVIKTTLKQGLDQYNVYGVDTDPNSAYFKISDFPDTLNAGKNYFLIEGSSFLKPGSDILVEVLDSEGNPLYVEIPDTLINGTTRVVSIYVYDGTPLGNATVTLLGVLKDAPGNWKNTYNVKWQRTVPVNTMQGDDKPAILLVEPTVAVEEIYDIGNEQSIVQIPFIVSHSAVSGAYGTIMGSKGNANAYYVIGLPTPPSVTDIRTEIPLGAFTSDMIGGTITFPSPNVNNPALQPSTYIAQIVDVLTDRFAIVSPAFTASNASTQTAPVTKFDLSEYTMSYSVKQIYTGSGNNIVSYLKIKIKDISTLSGIVKYADLYKQPGNVFLGRYNVTPNEMIDSGSAFEKLMIYTSGSYTGSATELYISGSASIYINNALGGTSYVDLQFLTSASYKAQPLSGSLFTGTIFSGSIYNTLSGSQTGTLSSSNYIEKTAATGHILGSMRGYIQTANFSGSVIGYISGSSGSITGSWDYKTPQYYSTFDTAWVPTSASTDYGVHQFTSSFDTTTLFDSINIQVTQSPWLNFSPYDFGSSSVAIWLDAYSIPSTSHGQKINFWPGKDMYGNSAKAPTSSDQPVLYNGLPTYTKDSLGNGTNYPALQFDSSSTPDFRPAPLSALEITASSTWMTPTASIYVVAYSSGTVGYNLPAGSVLGNRIASSSQHGYHIMHGYAGGAFGPGGTLNVMSSSALNMLNNYFPTPWSQPLRKFMMSITNVTKSAWANSASAANSWSPTFSPISMSYGNPTWSLFVGGMYRDMTYGGGPAWGGSWNGAIHEILVFNRQLKDWEHEKVQGYLAWKWGLTGSGLPLTQPYKTKIPSRPTGSISDFLIYNKSQLKFNKGTEYQLSVKLENSASVTDTPQLSFYITGAYANGVPASSSLAFRSTDEYGRLVSKFPIQRNTITYYSTNFVADFDGTGSVMIRYYNTGSKWNIANVSVKPFMNDNFSVSEFEFIIANPARRNEKFSLDAIFIGSDGKPVNTKYINVTNKSSKGRSLYQNMTGSNLVISHDDNLIEGSLFVGKNLRTGVQIAGENYAMVRSVGYEGFGESLAGPPPKSAPNLPGHGNPGFVIFSGSILGGTVGDEKRATYEGVGLELHGGERSGSLRFRADSTGSFLEISGTLDVQSGSFSGRVNAGQVQIGIGVGPNSGSSGIWINENNYWLFNPSQTGSGQVLTVGLTGAGGGYRVGDILHLTASSAEMTSDKSATILVKSINDGVTSASIFSPYSFGAAQIWGGNTVNAGNIYMLPATGSNNNAFVQIDTVLTGALSYIDFNKSIFYPSVYSGSGYKSGDILVVSRSVHGDPNYATIEVIDVVDEVFPGTVTGSIRTFKVLNVGSGYTASFALGTGLNLRYHPSYSIGSGSGANATISTSIRSVGNYRIIHSGSGYTTDAGPVNAIHVNSALQVDPFEVQELNFAFSIDQASSIRSFILQNFGTSYVTGTYIAHSGSNPADITVRDATASVGFINAFAFSAGDPKTRIYADQYGISITSSKAIISGSEVRLVTPYFHLGTDTNFIEGKDNSINISSSNLIVNKNNDGKVSVKGDIEVKSGLFTGKMSAGKVQFGVDVGVGYPLVSVAPSSASVGSTSTYPGLGTFYYVGDYVRIMDGNNDAIARVASVDSGGIYSIQLFGFAAEPYEVGEICTVLGGNNDCLVKIIEVDRDGSVLQIQILNPGTGYVYTAITFLTSYKRGDGQQVLAYTWGPGINYVKSLDFTLASNNGSGYQSNSPVLTTVSKSLLPSLTGVFGEVIVDTFVNASPSGIPRGVFLDSNNYLTFAGTQSLDSWTSNGSHSDQYTNAINNFTFSSNGSRTGSGYKVGDVLYAYQEFTSSTTIGPNKYSASLSSSKDAVGTVTKVSTGLRTVSFPSASSGITSSFYFGNNYAEGNILAIKAGDNSGRIKITDLIELPTGSILSASIIERSAGYQVGDILQIFGGVDKPAWGVSGSASLLVTSTSDSELWSGSISGIQLLTTGSGYVEGRVYWLTGSREPAPGYGSKATVKVSLIKNGILKYVVNFTGSGYNVGDTGSTENVSTPTVSSSAKFRVDVLDNAINEFQFTRYGSKYYSGQTASLFGGTPIETASIYVNYIDVLNIRLGNTSSFITSSDTHGVDIHTNQFYIGGDRGYISGSEASRSFEMSSSAFWIKPDNTIVPGNYEIPRLMCFGDGTDGNIFLTASPLITDYVTGSGGTVDKVFTVITGIGPNEWILRRDMNAINFTLDDSAVLNSNGYRLFAVESISIKNLARIKCSGSNGTAATLPPSRFVMGNTGSGGLGGGSDSGSLPRRNGCNGAIGGNVYYASIYGAPLSASGLYLDGPIGINAPLVRTFNLPSAYMTVFQITTGYLTSSATRLNGQLGFTSFLYITASGVSASTINGGVLGGSSAVVGSLSAPSITATGQLTANTNFRFAGGSPAAKYVLTASSAQGDAVWTPKW